MKKAEAQCVIPKLVTRWDVRETAVGAFGVKTHNRCFLQNIVSHKHNEKIKMCTANLPNQTVTLTQVHLVKLGYGVMVAQQILVLFVQVRILISQPD